MAYRINGVIRLADNGDANLGLVTATNVDVGVGSVTAAELYGKVSKEAITEQTDGDASDITGADELLIYDQETDSLLRVSVSEFTVGSGIVTSGGLGEFNNIVVTGLSTISGVEFNSGVITATSAVGVVTFYGDGSNLSELPPPSIVSATEPTTRPNGDALQEGDLWFFSGAGDGQLRQYTFVQGAFVDSNPLAAIPPLDVAGDIGNIAIGIGSDTLTFSGDDNVITTAVGSTVSIGLSDSISVASSITASVYYGDGSFLTGVGTAGDALFAQSAGVATNVNGGIATVTDVFVTGLGSVTASVYYGDGSNLTGVGTAGDAVFAKSAGVATNVSGGIVTAISGNFSGIVTAQSFKGDGSGLSGIAGTAGLPAVSADSLSTARSLWGQSFDGTTDVTGDITGATNITGDNSNMTIQPADSNTPQNVIIRGNDDTDGTGGSVTIGDPGRGIVQFQSNEQSAYKFGKAGSAAITGSFDFEQLTGINTYEFPNKSGTVALLDDVGGISTSASELDIVSEETSSDNFSLTFVPTTGITTVYTDGSGLQFNPNTDTLFAGKFDGDGSLLENLDATELVGVLTDGVFPAVLPPVDGSQLTGIAGSEGNPVDFAEQLATPRNLWGQSFDGSADVTGIITGATEVIGDNSTMTVQPADSNTAQNIIIRGNNDLDGTGGSVLIGDEGRGIVQFRSNEVSAYEFYKAGSAAIEGSFNFEQLIASQTYEYPNKSGTVALLDDITSGVSSSTERVDIQSEETEDNNFALAFVRTTGVATVYADTFGLQFNPSNDTLFAGRFDGDGFLLENLDATQLVGILTDGVFPAVLPPVDGSQLTGIAGTDGNPVEAADKLSTARLLWGQSFDGTANVTGIITGATEVIGDNSTMTIQPADSNTAQNVILRGNNDLDGTGGSVLIGDEGRGIVQFRSGVSGGYEFYKSGSASIEGSFDLEQLITSQTYELPNKSGTVALLDDITSGVSSSTERVDIVGEETSSSNFSLTFVPTTGVTTVYTDTLGLQFNPNTDTLFAGRFDGDGFLLENLNAEELVGILTDGVFPAVLPPVDGSQLTGIAGTDGNPVEAADKLSTARLLWGQSFDGTANVTGIITGATEVIGDNSTMTIQPADSNTAQNVILRGNNDLDGTGGSVTIGDPGRGVVQFQSSLTTGYEFYQGGSAAISGGFDFDQLTTTQGYQFPDKSGTIALLDDITGGISSSTERVDVEANNENTAFPITFVRTTGVTTVFADTDATYNPSSNTLTVGEFIGGGSGIDDLNASELKSGIIPDDVFPSTLPAVDGSQLTNLPGQEGNPAATAEKLETARLLWGQSFDGSADVSGDLTGVGEITGDNSDFFIQPADSDTPRTLFLRGNNDINNDGGGGVNIGKEDRGNVQFFSSNLDGYRFYQAGAATTSGALQFGALTGNQTYDFPDKSGTIALLDDITSGVSSRANDVLVDDASTDDAERLITFSDAAGGDYRRLKGDGSLSYNPSTGTLSADNFAGDGSSLSSITASNLIGVIPNESLPDPLPALDGSNLTGVIASGGISSTADSLTTARTLWGQSFDGTSDVSGNLSNVGNITGADQSITIQPEDSTVARNITIRGNLDTNSAGGGSVIIGDADRGDVEFRTSSNDGYQFTKAGDTGTEGRLRFGLLTGSQTYDFPDKSGTIALLDDITAGVASEAKKLETPRTIELTGDATGSVQFDGSQDVEIAVAVNTTNSFGVTLSNENTDTTTFLPLSNDATGSSIPLKTNANLTFDSTNGTLSATEFSGGGSGLTDVTSVYSDVAGVATYSSVAGVATYADVAGISTNVNGGIATVTDVFVTGLGSVTANTFYGDGSNLTGILTSGDAGRADYADVAGVATNVSGGIATVTDVFVTGVGSVTANTFYGDGSNLTGILTSGDAGRADYADVAGIATYADVAGIATYADVAGIATYAETAGIATNAGTATYAETAGIATNAGTATTSTSATNSLRSFIQSENTDTRVFLTFSQVQTGNNQLYTNPNLEFDSTNGTLSATSFEGDGSNLTGILTSGDAGRADYADVAGIATNAGIATYAETAGIATNAGTATTSISAENSLRNALASLNTDSRVFLTFAPTQTGNNKLYTNPNLEFDSTNGTLSATSFEGDGSNLTGILTSGDAGRADYADVAGIATNAGIATYAETAGIATNASNAERVDVTLTGNSNDYNVLFATGGSNQTVRYDGGITYNPGTNTLTVTNGTIQAGGTSTFSGNGSNLTNVNADTADSATYAETSGIATNAGTATTSTSATNSLRSFVQSENTDTRVFLTFAQTQTGNNQLYTNPNLEFNSTNGTLSATEFSGGGSGLTNVQSSTVTVSGAGNTTEQQRVLLANGTGNKSIVNDGGLTYNPSSNNLSVTGNVSAGSFTGNGSGLTNISADSATYAETAGIATNATTAANLSRSVVAGDGLTGGGQLNANRTLNVGAGDGISVAADSVAVDATVVRTTGDQTIGGTKTFSSTISGSIDGNAATADDATRAVNVGVSSLNNDSNTFITFVPNLTSANQRIRINQNLRFNSNNGTLFAESFSGDGSNLTNVTSDTISIGGTNINDNLRVLLSENGTGNKLIFNDGQLLYNPNSDVLTSGTFSGAFSGDGSSITSLNATQLTDGTVPAARLSGTYDINATSADKADYADTVILTDGTSTTDTQEKRILFNPSEDLAGNYSPGFDSSSGGVRYRPSDETLLVSNLNVANTITGTVSSATTSTSATNSLRSFLESETTDTRVFLTFSQTQTGNNQLYTNPSLDFDTTTGTLESTIFSGSFSGSGASLTNLPAGELTGSVPAAAITDIGNTAARIITLDNLEKSNLSADGQLSFDSSQGLLVYRTQQGTSGSATAVLDGWNVKAGTGIDITNLGAGGSGTEEFTFSIAADASIPNATAAETVSISGTNDPNNFRVIIGEDGTGVGRSLFSDGQLLYNPNTNVLTSTIFSGSGESLTSLPAGELTGTIDKARLPTSIDSDTSGNAATADRVDITLTGNGNDYNVLFANGGTNETLRYDGGITYNPGNNTLTVTNGTIQAGGTSTFSGNGSNLTNIPAASISGTVSNATNATNASNVFVTNSTTNGSRNVAFVVNDTVNSNRSILTTDLVQIRPSDGRLTAGSFVGNGSALTNVAAATADRLTTSRTLWGQSFNGTANVTGNMTGVTNITGSNANMVIEPQSSGNNRSLTIRGNSRTTGGGGNVTIGASDRGRISFQNGVSGNDGFRFFKTGANVSGRLSFELISANRSYVYPPFGGGVVVGTTPSSSSTMNGDIAAESFSGRGTVFAAVRFKTYDQQNNFKYVKRYNVTAVSFTSNSTNSSTAVDVTITYTNPAPFSGTGISDENKASNLAHCGSARDGTNYPGAFLVGPDGNNRSDTANGAGYTFYTSNSTSNGNTRVNANILDEISIIVMNIEATSAEGFGDREGNYTPPAP